MFETCYKGFMIKIEKDISTESFDLTVFDKDDSAAYASLGWDSQELALKKAKTYVDYQIAKNKFYGVTNA